MAIRKKKAARKRVTRTKSYMMVIRVRVPAHDVPAMKVLLVLGVTSERSIPHNLEILNAYYDKPGAPGAMPTR